MRSFPRNALTYAGICAALLSLAFLLVWTDPSRRRWGWLAVACCLFGAAFSLARGAWVAIAIGLIYVFVDTSIERRRKNQMVVAFLVAAVVLTGVFFIKYRVDPVTGRAGGGESVATREDLYKDTLGILKGPMKYIVLGYGTEKPRTESGTVKEGARYVPRAGTHSTYLNYLFRTGVPGALGIMALYALAFLHVRARARITDGTERTLDSLLATAIVIAAAHAVILSLYVEPIYTLTISLLLGVALAAAPERSALLPRATPA
jgi:O-antigen ligase